MAIDAAMTNYYELRNSEQCNCIILQLWVSGVWSGSQEAKVSVLVRLYSFWRFWIRLHFCAFSSLKKSENISYSVMSDSLQPHGLLTVRLLCPWTSPDKNTGVGKHSLPFSRRPLWPRDWTQISCIAGGSEPPAKPILKTKKSNLKTLSTFLGMWQFWLFLTNVHKCSFFWETLTDPSSNSF